MSDFETKTPMIIIVVEAFGYGRIRVDMVLGSTLVVGRFGEVIGPKDFSFEELVGIGDGGRGRR